MKIHIDILNSPPLFFLVWQEIFVVLYPFFSIYPTYTLCCMTLAKLFSISVIVFSCRGYFWYIVNVMTFSCT